MISSVNRNSPLPESEWVTVSTPGVRKPGQREPQASDLHKVTSAANSKAWPSTSILSAMLNAEPDILLQTRRPRETFRW